MRDDIIEPVNPDEIQPPPPYEQRPLWHHGEYTFSENETTVLRTTGVNLRNLNPQQTADFFATRLTMAENGEAAPQEEREAMLSMLSQLPTEDIHRGDFAETFSGLLGERLYELSQLNVDIVREEEMLTTSFAITAALEALSRTRLSAEAAVRLLQAKGADDPTARTVARQLLDTAEQYESSAEADYHSELEARNLLGS